MKVILTIVLILTSGVVSAESSLPDLEKTIKAANGGNVIAMHYLCYQYRYGDDFEADYKKAVKWCEKTAKSGDSDGQTLYAELLQYGFGTPVNLEGSVKWYLKAAEQDHVHALYMLFFAYAEGIFVQQDFNKAHYVLKRSADLGYEKAKELLKEIEDRTKAKV
ncbi:tetratricopeptide repeat protein [Amphritea japonica]|uniref:Sel1 repeat family protein n=1 Tax=Amphritea japonica ATCC BAA-1530 TaxID=1278309 RepID=A0A7R6SS43_9GAMM|nr:tetratricopeptide repeat protein [Amphritea japonica]BBB25934.1 hypothetical protein AMJAP_1339 [Amphritea japonica ATCC BAA-1530]